MKMLIRKYFQYGLYAATYGMGGYNMALASLRFKGVLVMDSASLKSDDRMLEYSVDVTPLKNFG